MSDGAGVTLQSESFMVFDDVLSAEARDALWNYFQLQPFQRVDALGMQGQWPLEDSGVLRGPTVGWNQRWDAQYPTKTPIDSLMRAVFELAAKSDGTVGTYGKDWKSFSASAAIYVSGQGRMWHRDADDDVGSWIYYGHPEWNIEWGGELFLAPDLRVPSEFGLYFHRLLPMADHPNPPPWKSHLDNQDANRLLMERAVGAFVAPKPNRMVIIRADTPRATAKIRASAGRQVHASVGGVFKRIG
jgi:hypothetical protein